MLIIQRGGGTLKKNPEPLTPAVLELCSVWDLFWHGFVFLSPRGMGQCKLVQIVQCHLHPAMTHFHANESSLFQDVAALIHWGLIRMIMMVITSS